MSSADAAPGEHELDLRAYLSVLRRRWTAIALLVVLGTGLAVALSVRQDEQYRAESRVLIRQRSTETLFTDDQPRSAQDTERDLNNEIEVLESGTIAELVDDVYDGSIDTDDVEASVSSDRSDVVTVSVSSTDPDEAARLVNLYVETYIEARRQQRVDELLAAGVEIQGQVDELTVQIAEARAPLTAAEEALAADPGDEELAAQRDEVAERIADQLAPLESQQAFYQQQLEDLELTANITSSGGAQVLTVAEPATVPASPKPLHDGVIGLVLGLGLGIFAAFLLDNLDERIRGASDLERASGGLSALALIPEVEGKLEPSFVAARDDPRSPAAEAFRSLRTSVRFAGLDRPLKVIQVTSASTGEGKTTVVANLAVALAQGGDRVALVCCDLRRPKIHERFDETLAPGFTDVIFGDALLSQAVRPSDANVYVLPAGSSPPNPSELLSSQRALAVIAAMAETFDVVLLDTTPVLPVTDALVVSRLVDATLVVIDARLTKRNALRRTLQLLGQVNAPLLGIVLNGVRPGAAYGYGYGYQSGYPYGDDEKPTGWFGRRRTVRTDGAGTASAADGALEGGRAPSGAEPVSEPWTPVRR
jgi:capsular exopolysaccharide synthesis family protein